jgi:hypothetical protein
VQGYKMRDENYTRYEYEDSRDHDGGIRTAVGAWFEDPAAAKAKYGPIASWDTSGITNMEALFRRRADFNEDISRWDVSNVVNMGLLFCYAKSFNGDLSSWNVGQVQSMRGMFHGATSFTHQLDGAWATSTAEKPGMFYNSPGTIAGKVKQAYGTIA